MEKRPHINSAWHEPNVRGESKTVQGKNFQLAIGTIGLSRMAEEAAFYQ